MPSVSIFSHTLFKEGSKIMYAALVSLVLVSSIQNLVPLALPPQLRVKMGMTMAEVEKALGEKPCIGITYGPPGFYVNCKYPTSGLWIGFDMKNQVCNISQGTPLRFRRFAAPMPREVKR